MANEQKRFCNQCPNHCPEDALSCGRGRAYFGVSGQENGERAQGEGRDGRGSHDGGENRGYHGGGNHGSHGGHGFHGSQAGHGLHGPQDGRGQNRPQSGMGMESESSNPLVQSLVKAAAIAEHKSSMMRMHGKDESAMFGALSPEEQEELAFLLDKVLGVWAEEHARHHQH